MSPRDVPPRALLIALFTLSLVAAAYSQTLKMCVPDYDVVDHVTVINSRRMSPPPHGTPTPRMLVQDVPIPPTRTPVPVGVCPDMDPGTTGYVEVPVTSLSRRGLTNTWTAWSVSEDQIVSASSNVLTPPRATHYPARLLP